MLRVASVDRFQARGGYGSPPRGNGGRKQNIARRQRPSTDLKKHQRLGPGIFGRRLLAGRAGVAVLEAVTGVVVAVKVVRDAVTGQLGVDLIDLLGRRVFVFVAEEADHRTADVAQRIERRLLLAAPGQVRAAAVIDDGAAELRHAAGAEQRHAAAHAVAHDDPPVAIDIGPPAQEIDGRTDIRHDFGILEELLALRHRDIARAAVRHVRHRHQIAGRPELGGDALGEVIETIAMVHQHDGGRTFAVVSARRCRCPSDCRSPRLKAWSPC